MEVEMDVFYVELSKCDIKLIVFSLIFEYVDSFVFKSCIIFIIFDNFN